MKYKVGDRLISKAHQEDLTIVGIDERSKQYIAKIDRLPDVEPFSYWEHEVEPWRYRRYVVDGNHYMKLMDHTDQYDPKFCGSGTWGVRDTIEDRVVFYVTSGSSRAIAMEICKQMNEGMLLKEMTQ